MEIDREFQSVINSLKSKFFFIACSGGIDSMVLLHLASKFNLDAHVLHVNYNLRGQESLEDANFLKDYCHKNNIPISIREVQLKEQLNEFGGNLQNEARKIRYDFFNSHLNKVKYSKLLIAHHLDDQIETFWLQLYRGAGLKGMAGMEKISGNYVRPFLKIPKTAIIEYAISNNIAWRDDKSNSSIDYQRNRWRNEFIPFLNKQIPNIGDSVLHLQQIFQENINEISGKINEVKNKIIETDQIELDIISEFQITEIVELFRSLSIPIHQVKPFVKLFNSQKGSKIKWDNSSGEFYEIIREANEFSFSRIEQKYGIPSLKIEQIDVLPENFDKTSFYFDLAKIKGELKIRFWQKGDRIFPIGMKGSKLISDIITDAKIPNSKRRNQLVICDEEKILACIGLCIDRRAIATKSSFILRVSLQNQSTEDNDRQEKQ
jgi:tRNA(Ile)-lysidine synthase